MGLIQHVWPRGDQPQGSARIKSDHRSARGLLLAYVPVPGGFVDLLGGPFMPMPGSTGSILAPGNPVDGNRGAARKLRSTEGYSNAGILTPLDAMSTGSTFSIFAEAQGELTSTRTIISSFDMSTGNGFDFRTDQSYVADGFSYFVNNYAANVLSASSALGANSQNFLHRLAVSYDGTTASMYAKRRLSNSGAIAAPSAHASRRTRLLASGANNSQASASLLLAWGRVLPLDEYQALYDNPWDLIEDEYLELPTAGAASGLPTLSAATFVPGSVTSSGWRPRFTATY